MLRWAISREGAAAAGLVEGVEGGSPVALEIRVDQRGRVASAAVADGGRRRELRARGGAEWVADGALWHLDIPGVVSVTLRDSERGAEAIYARTGLLARLGVEGGRYEFDGAVRRG